MFEESESRCYNAKYTDVKMDAHVKSLPLSALPVRTKRLLSCLMDTPKIIPSDGSVKLPRDWRGLASRLNISAELAASINQFEDKTGRVLEIWLRDPFATVGHLLEQLELLDRFDVYDDISSDLREYIIKSELAPTPQNLVYLNNNASEEPSSGEETRLITTDDQPGYVQQYHAFVLHAKEDQDFVDELVERMEIDGLKICTVDKLLAGHVTQYAPVAKLISERCKRIILVYSPDFLNSPSNKFYSTYAQAVSIETTLKIIPIMYRECQLPLHLTYYHRLYYKNTDNRAMYDFWPKLKQTLAHSKPYQPRLNGLPLKIPALNIPALNIRAIDAPIISEPLTTKSYLKNNEVSNDEVTHYINQKLFLQNRSMNDLDTLGSSLTADDSKSLSNISQISEASDGSKKKKSAFRRILKPFRAKKKKAILV